MPKWKQTAETQIEAFAEDLGRLLGSARAKADNWLGQRRQIVKHLTDIRDTASHLLTQLGDQAIDRRLVVEAAAMSAAQKARWAKIKKRRT